MRLHFGFRASHVPFLSSVQSLAAHRLITAGVDVPVWQGRFFNQSFRRFAFKLSYTFVGSISGQVS